MRAFHICKVKKKSERSCSLNASGLQAGSAYIHSASSAGCFNFDEFDIGLPHLVGSPVRMADLFSKLNALSTDLTFCHDSTSLNLLCIRFPKTAHVI